MASPLTVTSTPAATAPAIGGQRQQKNDTDAFAALLGDGKQQTSPSSNSSASTDISVGDTNPGSNDNAPDDEPEAVAGLMDAQLPIQTSTPQPSELLADLIGGLTAVKNKLDAGEPIGPDELAKLDAAMDGLADILGLDLKSVPTMDQLATLAAAIDPANSSLGAQLTKALAPLAQALLDTDGLAQADALAAIGEKLGSFLAALNDTDASSPQATALGLNATTDAQSDLTAALTRLMTPTVNLNAPAIEPVPVAAEAEPVALTPPSANLASDIDLKAEPDTDSPSDRDRQDNAPADKTASASEAKTATAVADAKAETQAVPQSSTQPAARAELVAAPRVVQAGYQTSQQQLNLPQIAFELARQSSDGNTRFQIRLDPAELGRIDVRLDIDSSGQVNARLTVEKAETLDLMQRDQRALERALQQAGLDGAKTSLEFSLRQNSSGQQGQPDHRGPTGGQPATAETTPPPTINLYRSSLSASGVNIFA